MKALVAALSVLAASGSVLAQDELVPLAQNLVKEAPERNVVLGYQISKLPRLPNAKPDKEVGEWTQRLAQIADIPEVAIQQHSGRLFVNTTRANHLTIQRVLERVKTHGFEQVDLECRVLIVKDDFEVKDDAGKQLFPLSVRDYVFSKKAGNKGFGFPGESRTVQYPSFQKILSDAESGTFLDAAEKSAVVRTENMPRIITLSGMTAGISSGGEMPLVVGLKIDGNNVQPRIAFQQFGLKTNCTPLVLANDQIRLRLSVNQQDRPKVKTKTIGKLNGQNLTVQIPEVHRNIVHATCTMEPGQSLLLGGPVSIVSVPTRRFGIELAAFGTEPQTEQMWVLVTPRLR